MFQNQKVYAGRQKINVFKFYAAASLTMLYKIRGNLKYVLCLKVKLEKFQFNFDNRISLCIVV